MSVGVVRKRFRMELARCEYIQRRENGIAVGNSGTGKTHVALVLQRLFAKKEDGHAPGFCKPFRGGKQPLGTPQGPV